MTVSGILIFIILALQMMLSQAGPQALPRNTASSIIEPNWTESNVRKVIELSSEQYGYEALLEPFTLRAGLYRYFQEGLSYFGSINTAELDQSTRDKDGPCSGVPASYDAFGRMSFDEPCTFYLTIKDNKEKVPWLLRFELER